MFAPLYHAHHALYQEDLPFWLGLAHRYGDPILELGCGTGRVLLPLSKAGFRVVGLDNDLGMLIWLRQNFQKSSSRQPLILQADMTSFRLGDRFALILLPCNTLSSLTDLARKRVYSAVAAHLRPQGGFAFSIANPRLLQRLPRRGAPEIEETLVHPLTGNPLQVSSAWTKTHQRFNLTWHYDHLSPDGSVERFSITTQHTLQPVEVYEQEIAAAGLRIVACWGDFDQSSYHVDSPHWIVLAEPTAGSLSSLP